MERIALYLLIFALSCYGGLKTWEADAYKNLLNRSVENTENCIDKLEKVAGLK